MQMETIQGRILQVFISLTGMEGQIKTELLKVKSKKMSPFNYFSSLKQSFE